MIIVTGTKRSGTSMWMQILIAAGFNIVGEAFPKRWEQTLKDANPNGFYESIYRNGIYYRTNPNPFSGKYMRPEPVAGHAVKVFIPGLVRSDLAFVGKVVATMRPWREYESSLDRLLDIEDIARKENGAPPSIRIPHYLEWWVENFMLLRDIGTRGYPTQLHTYDDLLSDPEKVVTRVVTWLGGGDIEAAIAAVKPKSRTQQDTASEFDGRLGEAFDELYEVVHTNTPISRTLLTKFEEVHKIVGALYDDALRKAHGKMRRQNASGRKKTQEALEEKILLYDGRT